MRDGRSAVPTGNYCTFEQFDRIGATARAVHQVFYWPLKESVSIPLKVMGLLYVCKNETRRKLKS